MTERKMLAPWWVERLPHILERRSEGATLQQIGDEYGVTRERVRQVLQIHGDDPGMDLIGCSKPGCYGLSRGRVDGKKLCAEHMKEANRKKRPKCELCWYPIWKYGQPYCRMHALITQGPKAVCELEGCEREHWSTFEGQKLCLAHWGWVREKGSLEGAGTYGGWCDLCKDEGFGIRPIAVAGRCRCHYKRCGPASEAHRRHSDGRWIRFHEKANR